MLRYSKLVFLIAMFLSSPSVSNPRFFLGEGDDGGDGMMKALSKITGQAKALKFAMDLAKNRGFWKSGETSRSELWGHSSGPHVGGNQPMQMYGNFE